MSYLFEKLNALPYEGMMGRNTRPKIMLGIFDLRYCNHFSIPYTRAGIMDSTDFSPYFLRVGLRK